MALNIQLMRAADLHKDSVVSIVSGGGSGQGFSAATASGVGSGSDDFLTLTHGREAT